MNTGARSLIIGWDGATWQLAHRFLAEGRMPVLDQLLREGSWSRMQSTTPPMTLPSWSAFLTGCNPGKHGIFDFTRRVPGTYQLEFTNATHRRVPTLHRLLSDRGARVASIAVPTTYPPETLNGVVISGFDSPVATSIDGSFCHPKSVYTDLKARFGRMKFADFQEIHIGPTWHDEALTSLLEEIPRKEGIGCHLLKQERWDAFMLLFGESDTVCHHFWHWMDDASPRHPPNAPTHLREAIATVYSRLDEALGRLMDAASPDHLVIASDHGFGGAGDVVLYLNRYLESRGLLEYHASAQTPASGGLRTGSGLTDTMKALALKHLPARAQEQLVRNLPKPVLGHIESKSRYGDIAFDQTTAFSDEMNYAATVWLNIEGRDPQGTIKDPSKARADIRAALTDWEVDGHRVVERIHDREDLYHGECIDRAPDLVLDLALRENYSYTLLPSGRVAEGTTWRRLAPEERHGGKGFGMPGSHRSDGFLFLWGDGVRPGVEFQSNMTDPMPTILHLLDEAIPDHVDGRVLNEALQNTSQVQHSVFQGDLPSDAPLDDTSAEELAKRLEALGYL